MVEVKASKQSVKISPCAEKILFALRDADAIRPGFPLTKQELAKVTGYSHTSGSFSRAIRELRQHKLVAYLSNVEV